MARKDTAMITKTPMEKAESQIRLCAVLAYLSAIVTVIFSVLGYTAQGSAIFSIAVGVIIGALGFGVSKKSRACAIALLAIFCVDTMIKLSSGGDIGSMSLSILIWGYAYICGVQGTFAYKKLKAEHALWLADTDTDDNA